MPAKISLIGKRFGRLKVIKFGGSFRNPNGVIFSKSVCKCDCGKEVIVRSGNLTVGHTRSCGCLAKELCKTQSLIHGHNCHKTNGKPTPTYKSWQSMLYRISGARHWKNYGARGISVCERWMKFENFLTDMGERPSGLTLDRIDNNGNYAPGNCRWATRVQQCRNKRNNHILTVSGMTGCLSDLADHFKKHPLTVLSRLRRGWNVERAFLEPVKRMDS